MKLPKWAQLTAIPASIIDQLYLNEKKGFWGFLWTFILIRAVYVGLFIPFAWIDLSASLVSAFYYGVLGLFTSDGLQDYNLSQQKKYASIYSKTFYSFLAIGLGIISPKLIAFYFTPEREKEDGISSGGKYHQNKDAKVVYPSDEAELITVLKNAKKNNQKIMPIGAGFSQGKQYLPDGSDDAVVIDMDNFNSIEINTREKTVTVGAGAIWSSIQAEANKHKLALKVMQASNVFSVGGSLSTNIHGWNIKEGSLSKIVQSIEVILPDGSQQTLTPSNDENKPGLFEHVIGGLGLFGIITKATLKLTDNELLQEKGTKVEPKDYVKYFHEKVQTSETTRMHLYRLSLDPNNLLGTGVAVSYEKTDQSLPLVTQNLQHEAPNGTRMNRVLVNFARRLAPIRRYYWNSEEARLLANDSPPLTTNDIMQPPINAMFNPSVSEAEWLQEYFLPGDSLDAFLSELGQLLMDNKVVLLNASVRFVPQCKNHPMSYAQSGDRFAVVLCFNQSLREEEVIKARKWIRQSQDITVKHGGSYYLPYQQVSSPETFNESYPQAREAYEFKKTIDPQETLSSGFYQKYMVPNDKPNHFKIMMSSEENKKAFAGFLEVVLQRVDSKPFFDLLSDILEYNDTHEEIYQELCKRLPEVMPGAIGSLKRILESLSSIKSDLGAQARMLLPSSLKTIDGLVEIGYPGRFVKTFTDNYTVKGPIVAVLEGESITDYIQTGGPRPYDRFAKLDYKNPNLSDLADNSADVITCYVGLHHFTKEGLDVFLKDVKRVLRDNGHFLLVDHDVTDDITLTMAHMAHSIFNAVTGVPIEEELNEVRLFAPIEYWKNKLAEHGLSYDVTGADEPMIREGDPSKNRMVSFAKKSPVLNNQVSQEEITSDNARQNDVVYKPLFAQEPLPEEQHNPNKKSTCTIL